MESPPLICEKCWLFVFSPEKLWLMHNKWQLWGTFEVQGQDLLEIPQKRFGIAEARPQVVAQFCMFLDAQKKNIIVILGSGRL